MARVDIVMPQMGESIAEGTLSKWLKRVGDPVKRDEPLFEISTDKVDAEIPAPNAGVLAEIIVREGQTVPVQTVVARLETDVAAFTGAADAAPPAGPMVEAPPPMAQSPMAQSPMAQSPMARSAAGAALSSPVGEGSGRAAPSSPDGGGRVGGEKAGERDRFEERIRTRSSPLVRKMAAEHGIELVGLRGTGIAGRVTKRDILAALESGRGAEPTEPPGTAAQAVAGAAPSLPGASGLPSRPSMYAPGGVEPPGGEAAPHAWPGDVLEPMSRIRQLTAEHMVMARRVAAHVTSVFEIDLTRVARLRAREREAFERTTGQKLTYLPFIIKAVVEGLKRHPVLNAVVSGSNILFRKRYNIGIAVALDWGLIVPVIRNADDLSLSGLTRQLNDMATRARTKRLDPREVQEATFTITNPGVFGSLMGTPIIPVGTSAILGVGAIEKRARVLPGSDGEDVIAIRTCAYFSLSFDHRIVDGADADAFLAFVKERLEAYPDQGL